MPSINGDVQKGCHGFYDVANPTEEFENFLNEKTEKLRTIPLRCKYCNAKLFPNEFSTEKKISSNLCCANGQIKCEGYAFQMAFLREPPGLIKDLFTRLNKGQENYDPFFIRNIRKYNNALCMASIGFDDQIVQKDGWTPNVKIQGKIYHRHGPLFPSDGEKPKFAQIIVHDGNLDQEQMYLNQLERRMEVARGKSSKALQEKYVQAKAAMEVNRETMYNLQKWLHENNSYYLSYKALAQINPEEISDKILIILKDEKPKNSEDHIRQWNLPECNEVAIIDLSNDQARSADIRVHLKDGSVKRINETHRSFQALHYTLLFP